MKDTIKLINLFADYVLSVINEENTTRSLDALIDELKQDCYTYQEVLAIMQAISNITGAHTYHKLESLKKGLDNVL